MRKLLVFCTTIAILGSILYCYNSYKASCYEKRHLNESEYYRFCRAEKAIGFGKFLMILALIIKACFI